MSAIEVPTGYESASRYVECEGCGHPIEGHPSRPGDGAHCAAGADLWCDCTQSWSEGEAMAARRAAGLRGGFSRRAFR